MSITAFTFAVGTLNVGPKPSGPPVPRGLPVQMGRQDRYYGGDGILTHPPGQPVQRDGTPFRAEIIVLDARSKLVVRSAWSRADGTWEVPYIARVAPGTGEPLRYIVFARDHTKKYNAIIYDDVAPDPMP